MKAVLELVRQRYGAGGGCTELMESNDGFVVVCAWCSFSQWLSE